MSGQLEGDHGPSPTPLGSVLAAGSPSQTFPEPTAQYYTSMDQMVEDVISKTTAQVPPTSTATMPPNQFDQSQFTLAPQSHSIPSWNPSETSARQMYHVMPPPQIPPSSSLPKATSSIDPSNRLPQDILHILQSDFTGDSADAQAQKDQNISRVAEELRVKVRLSRYRRVRDQLSDSEDEVSESSDDNTVNNSEENTLHQDNNDNIDPPDDDEADLIDGSGDEEEERQKNNKALAKLRMEIEQIIGIPQDANLSDEGDKSVTELGEEESTRGEELDKQTAIQVTGETQEISQTKPSGEAKGTANSRTIERLSVAANELIVNLESKLSPNTMDGGSIEEERQKHNEALAKLRMEVQQITGISHGASLLNQVEETVMELDEEKESTKAKGADLQTGIQVIGGTEGNSPTKPPGEVNDAASCLTIEQMIVDAKELLAKMNSINSQNKSQGIAPIAASQKLPATCSNEEPSASIQIATPTSLSTTMMVVVEPDQPGSSTLANPQVTKPRKKPPPKKSMAKEVDSGDESEDAGQGTNVTLEGPTTANELKEPPPEITEVPFTRVSDEAIDSLSPFGSITSLIGHVLVIQGTAGLGYDRVLDEGTVVCQKDGLVIGKIFETFGSVTNPHYSIRLPNHILTCKDRNNDEGLDLSAGSSLYYLPTHSNFVFTAELKAQPKGTDASNFFDEEPENADEIEFSDDEAEAAYRQACKFARKAARDPNGNSRHHNQPRGHHSKQQQRNSVQVPENGRRMFVKMTPDHLNYGADDGNIEGRSGTVDSDYSILQRPRGPPESNDKSTPTSLKSTSRQSSAQRSRGKKRGTVGRDRNSRRPPPRQSHPSTGQPGNGAAASSNLPTGNQSPGLQPRGTTNPGITNQSVFPNPESHDAQAQTNDQGSMMMAPAQMDMNLTGLMASTAHPQDMYSSSSYTSMWNPPNGVPPVQNQMMIPMMMNYASHAGIPSYNPHLPSAPAPSTSSLNPVFQFGASQDFQDTNHCGYPNQLPSQQVPGYNHPSHPSFQFLQQQQMQTQHIQFQSQQTQNNQPPHHTPSRDNPNLGHYNPWFYGPS